MNATKALTHLQEGNNRFVNDRVDNKLINSTRRKALTEGQQPWAVILTCSDSRVVPELIFDTGLGELFVIRIAGNIASTESIASIEFAVAILNTKLIVVLGHENCGAVTTAVNGGNLGNHLNNLFKHIQPAITASKKGDSINEITKKNAEIVCQKLIKNSSIISNAMNEGLEIKPAFYLLETGQVNWL